jgi:hypothetical protein
MPMRRSLSANRRRNGARKRLRTENSTPADRERRDLGEAKIEMLDRAGYRWQGPPPGVFSHPETRDAIDYFAVLNATFAELAQRIAPAS